MTIDQKDDALSNVSKIVFASQREYEIHDGELMTIGPIGAETGENYRTLFPTMKIIGRKKSKLNASIKVPCKDYHLIRLNLKSPYLVFDYFVAIYKILRIVGSADGVIVRAGGLGTLVAIVGIVRLRPVGIEVGGCVFNSLWHYGNILGKIAAPFSYLLRCLILQLADRVQMVTQDYLQNRYFIKLDNQKCIGISNVAISRHPKSILENRINRNLNNKKIILGSIGSFNGTFKGHDIAIKTCYLLNEKGYKVELRILGAGDQKGFKDYAKSMNVADKVFFYNPVKPGKEVESWLSDIDIYCQFSRREGISRALIEAMNLAIPVVASNAGGTYEIVNNKSLFEIDDIKSATNIIEKLINDNDFYSSMCCFSYESTKQYEENFLSKKRIDFWRNFGS